MVVVTSGAHRYCWIPLYVFAVTIGLFPWRCSAQGGIQAPTFGIVLDLSTYNVTLTAGDTLAVNASYESTPAAHFIIWLKGATQLYVRQPSDSVAGRLVVLPPLTITNVGCSDAGEYLLFVNNSRGQHFSSPLRVYVIIPSNQPVNEPGNPYCLHAPICSREMASDVFEVEGQSLTLRVNITSNPSLNYADYFFSNNLINRTDPRYQNGDSDSPSLSIQQLRRTDAGGYRITANNTIGPLRESNCIFNLTVGYPPEFECGCNTTQCHVVNESESCFFPVNNIDAYPPHTSVQWFKDNEPVVNATGRIRGGNLANPSLTVVNTNRNDSGDYTVTAQNVVGGIQGCRCCCVVQFPPTCTQNFPLVYNVTEGNSFTIFVTLTALPLPDFVDWTLNNVPINRTGSRYIDGDTTTASLTIQQIHRSDAGLYILIANNIVGSIGDTNCRANVTVYYVPLCTLLSPSVLSVNEFSTFTINVTIDSVPPAQTVEWSQNGMPVNRAGGRFVNGNSYSVPSLTIRNVTRQETGIYVLSAANIIGSITDSDICRVNVTILYRPDICPNGCPRNYSACENTPVTLECTTVALPAINRVIWRRDGLTLNVSSPRYSGGTANNPSLTINNVVAEDSGAYACMVWNTVGTRSYNILLEVLSKPAVSVTQTNVVLVEGQSSSIGCSVDMRTNPAPVVVQWFKDGVQINSQSGRYQHGDTDIPSLTITNIQRDDAGVYSCSAINAIGDRQSRNIIVTVEYPPVVKARYTNYGIPMHTNATLWCSVDANPPVSPANVTWVRDGLFQLPSTSCTDVRPDMTLCNVVLTASGVYRCRANHRLATKHSEDIHVNIRDTCPLEVSGIRLSDGPSANSGRVEVLVGDIWGTVCGRYWNPEATLAVCGMAGYSYGTSSFNTPGTGPIHIGHVRCGVGATTLRDCGLTSISNCTHNEDIWVQCSSVPATATTLSVTAALNATAAATATTAAATTTTPLTTTTTASSTSSSSSTTTTTLPSTEVTNTTTILCDPVPTLYPAIIGVLSALLVILLIILIAMLIYYKPCCRDQKDGDDSSSFSDDTPTPIPVPPRKPPKRQPQGPRWQRGPILEITNADTNHDTSEKNKPNTKENKKLTSDNDYTAWLGDERKRKDRENEVRKMRRKNKKVPEIPSDSDQGSFRDTLPLIETPPGFIDNRRTPTDSVKGDGKVKRTTHGARTDDSVPGGSGNGRESKVRKDTSDLDEDIRKVIDVEGSVTGSGVDDGSTSASPEKADVKSKVRQRSSDLDEEIRKIIEGDGSAPGTDGEKRPSGADGSGGRRRIRSTSQDSRSDKMEHQRQDRSTSERRRRRKKYKSSDGGGSKSSEMGRGSLDYPWFTGTSHEDTVYDDRFYKAVDSPV